MSEKDIWISDAMMDPQRGIQFQPDAGWMELDELIIVTRKNAAGEAIAEAKFPKEMYGNYRDVIFKPLTGFGYNNGFYVVPEPVADILREFDLGNGALYPVKIFQHDRKTPVDGTYFCINFGNVKNAFLPEKSPRARRRHIGYDVWKPALDLKHDDIALRETALGGPDLWVDPLLVRAFFVSGRLAQALKSAKLAQTFGLRKCRVFQDN